MNDARLFLVDGMHAFISQLRQENPLPGFVLYCFLGIVLLVLVNLGFLPEPLLYLYGGAGFVLAGVLVPGGLHSTWNGLYFLLVPAISYSLWWLLWLVVRGQWRR